MNRKSGVIMSFILLAIEIITTLLLTPLIIKNLGQAEYGVYKLSFLIVSYLALLDLGVGNSIVRFVSKYRINGEIKQCRKFIGVSQVYYIIIAIVSIIIGVILMYFFPILFSKGLSFNEIELGKKLLMITMINTSFTLLTSVYPYVIIAYERFVFSKIISIIKIVIKFVLIFIALNIGMKSISIVCINLGITIIERMVYFCFILFKLKLKPDFSNLKFNFIKEIIIYSAFIFLQMVATQINLMADQILIGIYVKSSSIIIGIYGVGAQINQYFQSIGSSFTGVLMPGVVKLVEKKASKEEMCAEMVKIGRIIFMFLSIIWICFFSFGQSFITMWIGNDYFEAYYISVILMTVYLFIYTESIGSQILWALNKHKEQSILKISVVVLNIFLTIILIKWKPLLGAVIGTFVSLLLGDVLMMNIIFKKKIGISLKKYYVGLSNGIVWVILLTFLFSRIILHFNFHGILGLVLNVILTCFCYIMLLYFLGINDYEKKLLLSIFKIKQNKKE